jgi:hypothetical protein
MKMLQSFIPRPEGETMEAFTLSMLLFYALGFWFGPDGVTDYGGFGIYGITGDDKAASLLVRICTKGCPSVETFIARGRGLMERQCETMAQSVQYAHLFQDMSCTFWSGPRPGKPFGELIDTFPAGRVRTADPHLSRPSRI